MQLAHQQSLWSAGMQAATESTVTHAETSDTNDGFLGRPVKIATFAWQVNTPLFHTFNPWSAFCEDPRVINRLAHFKNLRMNLHVQFLINGNPFYYGRAIASYIPLQDSDNYSEAVAGNFLQLVPSSQRPHVYLDPTKSEGGELILPFIFPKTYMDIPSSEWTKMGTCVLQNINNLLHANEQGDSVDITVFAFASEVSLNTPTCQVPSTLVPQGNDEYGKISYPAHLIANWAGRLANAPVIGAYARATQMIASTAAGVASMFGYSRPNAPAEDICTMKLFPGHATTNERDDAITLAVDGKREITIDPRVVGVSPQDEMALVPLAMKESYFGQFPWNTDNFPDEHLCSIRVSPMLGNVDLLGGPRYAMTPMAWVAYPFRYWKGSIIIRLQVVCSAYHRGRLRVVWDPDHCNDNCAEMFNTNYSMLLDITESQDVTFKIGWGANTDYLPVPPIEDAIVGSYQYANFTDNAFGCNGTLSVYVVNGLTCPGSVSTPVSVNMFACAAEDFEVAVPYEIGLRSLEADGTVGPIPPPTDGPGSTPDPPAVNDLIVPKRHFAVGSIYDPSPDPAFMRGTVYDSRTQELWVYPGTRTFNIPAWGGGTTNVLSADIILEFRNHQAVAKDISLTIGGNTVQDTLPPNIGATVVITVPNVTLVAGYQDIPVSIEVANNGRVLLSHVTSTYPQSYTRVAVTGSNLLNLISNANATLGSVGSWPVVQNTTDDNLIFLAPSNYAVGTRAYFTSNYGQNVNGIDQPFDGLIGNRDLVNMSYISAPVAVGDQWQLTQGTSTNWEAEWFMGVYYIDSTLPAPEGQDVRTETDPYLEFLAELARAELEDLDDFKENVVPDELIPQGNCLRYINLGKRSDEHEVLSFEKEMKEVDFYISSSDEEALTPQGDDDTPEERNDDKDDANAPEHETVDLSMGPSSDVPGLPQIYFGEQVTSWRQMLKRYHMKFQHAITAASGNFLLTMAVPPTVPPGDIAIGNDRYRSAVHLLDYVAPAYVCMRGSLKVRMMPEANARVVSWIQRRTYEAGRVFGVLSASVGYATKLGFGGAQMLDHSLAHAPAIEVPWYSRFRFHHARTTAQEDPDNYNERDCLEIASRCGVSIGAIDYMLAVGEDFSLSAFLAVPYYVPN